MKEKLKNSALAIEGFFYANLEILLLGFAALTFAVFLYTREPQNNLVNSTVMITNLARNSGGTGVVLESTKTASLVLTNSHVCKVVENGGLVIHNGYPRMVASYKRSDQHDICLITVNANLGVNTRLATRPPRPFEEKALVSGHPNLIPTVVSTGHFSGSEIIPVMAGFEPCDTNEAPENALACLLFGGKPIIKIYESTLVTATIMPGSSGSGVYDSDNNLTGLVFAGSGEFGYAWTVPYFALANFLTNEAKTLKELRPGELAKATNNKAKSFTVSMEKVKEVCASPKAIKIKDLCRLIKRDLIWNQ